MIGHICSNIYLVYFAGIGINGNRKSQLVVKLFGTILDRLFVMIINRLGGEILLICTREDRQLDQLGNESTDIFFPHRGIRWGLNTRPRFWAKQLLDLWEKRLNFLMTLQKRRCKKPQMLFQIEIYCSTRYWVKIRIKNMPSLLELILHYYPVISKSGKVLKKIVKTWNW